MEVSQAIGKEHMEKLLEDVEMLDSLIPAPDLAKIHVRHSLFPILTFDRSG